MLKTRRSLLRLVGAATAAITAGALISVAAGTPPAGAVVSGASGVALPPGATVPTILTGKTGQATAPINVFIPNTWQANDQVRITFTADPGAGTTTTNGFNLSSTPTLTVTPTVAGSPAATVSAPVVSASGANPNLGNDTITFTLTNTAPASNPQAQIVTVSGLQFDVGATTTPDNLTATETVADAATPTTFVAPGAGPAPYNVNDMVDAVISAIQVTANTPPSALVPATAGQGISNIVITELQVSQIPSGNWVCVSLLGPGNPGDGHTGPNFTATNAPTITAPAGSGVSSIAQTDNSGNSSSFPVALSFQVVTTSTTTPYVFTISGVKVDTHEAFGPIVAGVGQSTTQAGACGNAHSGDGNIDTAAVLATIIGVKPLAGATRADTAAAIYDWQYGVNGQEETCPSNAIITRGDLFPDALSASYLAKYLETGILLTQDPNTLPTATLNELKLSGVTDVFIVGGSAAVSPAIISQLSQTPAYVCGGSHQQVGENGNQVFLKVTVIGGATRYDTDQMVVQYPQASWVATFTMPATGTYTPGSVAGTATPSPRPTAIIATGENFPDAITGGAIAHGGYEGPGAFGSSCYFGFSYDSSDAIRTCGTGGAFPLIITPTASLGPQAQAALVNLGISNALVVGGSAAVSSATVSAIQGTGFGIQTLQFSGANRSDTSQQVAQFAQTTWADAPPPGVGCPNFDNGIPNGVYCTKIGGLGYSSSKVTLARGDNFPDALTGAVLDDFPPDFTLPDFFFHETQSPVLLAASPTSLGTEVTGYLTNRNVGHMGPYQAGGGALGFRDPDFYPASFGGITFMYTLGGTAALAPTTIGAALAALAS